MSPDWIYRCLVLSLFLGSSGCIIGAGDHSINLETEVIPSKVSLEAPEPIYILAHAKNIGTSAETISADVIKTEGLSVLKPEKTEFVLKPDESRTITFTATLTENAVPGDYIIDIQIRTKSGDLVWDRARLRVVEKKGLL
ncbi:MAG: hypothetical protein GXO65_03145 [Euryarchaeota archaeon]|nr:hypothetical protein [Euryarchaeota archaeon]